MLGRLFGFFGDMVPAGLSVRINSLGTIGFELGVTFRYRDGGSAELPW